MSVFYVAMSSCFLPRIKSLNGNSDDVCAADVSWLSRTAGCILRAWHGSAQACSRRRCRCSCFGPQTAPTGLRYLVPALTCGFTFSALRVFLRYVGCCVLLGLGLAVACYADSSAEDIYDLPEGVEGTELDAASNWTLHLEQFPLIKFPEFVSNPSDGDGRNCDSRLELYWKDPDWTNCYYFPIPAESHPLGVMQETKPYNGSHVVLPKKLKKNRHHLLAVRVDNLQFMGGYYTHDFEARIKLYGVKSSMKSHKAIDDSEASRAIDYSYLDLLTDNPHLKDQAATRVQPGSFLSNETEQVASAAKYFSVSDNGHANEKISGYSVGMNGPAALAFDGVMHTYYNSHTTVNPYFIVDLQEERPVDRIIIRWQGEGKENQTYKLYAFDASHKRKSISAIDKLFKSKKDKVSEHCIYSGTTNAARPDLNELVTRGGSYNGDHINNNTISGSTWIKTNSYYWVRPNSEVVNDDVNEVFEIKDRDKIKNVRYIVFQGEADGTEAQAFTISEMEVFAFPVKRHQTEDPRLFTAKTGNGGTTEEVYLLYNSTLSGRIYDDYADGGKGRHQFIAKISKHNHKYVVYPSDILKLQIPSSQTYLRKGRYFVEKNLTPFNDYYSPEQINIIYGYNPLLVYKVNRTTGVMEELSKTYSNANDIWGDGKLGPIRGGTPAIYDDLYSDDPGDPHYLTFFHSSTRDPYYFDVGTQTQVKHYTYTYYTGLLRFKYDRLKQQYVITHVTPDPILVKDWYYENVEKKKVAFASGLTRHPEFYDPDSAYQKCYYISSGIGDERVDVTLITPDIIDSMVEVTEGNTRALTSPLDLYVVIGNANASGRAEIEKADGYPIPNAYLLNQNGKWTGPNEPMNFYSNIREPDASPEDSNLKLGPAGTLARTLLDVKASLGRTKHIGLIVNSRGGTISLRSWLPKGNDLYEVPPFVDDTYGGLYEQTKKRILQALKDGNQNVLKGVIILAGAGDLSRVDGYQQSMSELIHAFRTDPDFGDPNLPFVTATVLDEPGYAPDARIYNDAQYKQVIFNEQQKPALNNKIKSLASTPNRIAVVDLNGALYGRGDGTHYNTTSIRALGAAIAKEMDALAYPEDYPSDVNNPMHARKEDMYAKKVQSRVDAIVTGD